MSAEVNAIVLTADGNAEVKYVDPHNLQEVVGGWLEHITPGVDTGIDVTWHAYCNEEGKLEGLPRNFNADAILTELGWLGVIGGDFIVGTVVLLGSDGPKEADVPDAVLKHVLAYYRAHGEVQTG